jgi:hypothetical protein
MPTINSKCLRYIYPKSIAILGALALYISLPAMSLQAAIYYLSPNGSDSNAGTSSEAPWKTFDFAISQVRPGDSLNLLDGTYQLAGNGALNLTGVQGAASAPITIKAVNERRAWLKGDGSVSTISMLNSSYIILDGLRVSSADLPPLNGPGVAPIYMVTSSHITLRNLLVHNSNRYRNAHLIMFVSTTDSLVEDTELYYFHRHAISLNDGGGAWYSSDRNTIRRVYCNHRIGSQTGQYQGENAPGADMCVTTYPANYTLVENLISEGNQSIFDIQALGPATNNRYLGIVQLGGYGPVIKTREPGNSVDYMPINNTIRDFVHINGGVGAYGMYSRSARGTICDHCSFINNPYAAIIADVQPSYPGDGRYSITITNSLALNTGQLGFYIADAMQSHPWTITKSNAYLAAQFNYYPAQSPNYSQDLSINPALGSCKLWIPDGSPMKGAGLNGEDIGATVLYRYQDGVLTNIPLWDPSTGKFPCRSVVAGINDVPGSSCFDVHQRLSVNTGGCAFPGRYAQNRDTTPPSTPQIVSVQ